ncbi:acetyl-CoA synthetase-like protein [Aspergillus ellipticus CBS 707.79]|uniref:Acetyl-CoA synthetase-like protein n=1 Tax=Aspergillus ellipticus CBS 707.79 TaxID=1448320 RepID=A0A319E8N6_9EURO|nr:acetyl-CoA synthetase-like protein [Aspergillus ellipticus CBS 707.79]
MTTCFSTAINNFLYRPASPLADFNLIDPQTIATLAQWNSHPLASVEACVHDVFHQKALARTDAPAICSWDGEFTYQELDQVSSALARLLRSHGVDRGSIVPFCFQKSAWAVIAMLGTLKAGAATVALSSDFPPTHLNHILSQANATVCLVDRKNHDGLKHIGVELMVVEPSLFEDIPNEASTVISQNSTSKDIAFIQYTSGTTGVPKGVVLEHGAFMTGMGSLHQSLHIVPESRVLQFASYIFDASLMEVFATLTVGSCLCIPSEEQRFNNLGHTIRSMNVSWVFMTPLFAQNLRPKDLEGVRTILMGGECASQSVIDRLRTKLEVLNGYGPSECTVCCSVNNWSLGDFPDRENIGYATSNSHLWVVSPENPHQLAPLGAIGELVIQGPSLARGYLHNDEATQRAFIDPSWLSGLSAMQSRRVYRTGDLVRYQTDGSLQFLGRNDSQVKITGRRVELKSVEVHLAQCAPVGISTTVEAVKLQAGQAQRTILVAFYWPSGAKGQVRPEDSFQPLPATAETKSVIEIIESKLRNEIASYTIPTFFLPLPFMPMNLSGKLDRRQLKSVVSGLPDTELALYAPGAVAKVKPRNELEGQLQQLWSKVLGIEPETVGIHDTFYRLGGESVTAIALSALAREHGLPLLPADILTQTDLASQAAVLQEKMANTHKDAPKREYYVDTVSNDLDLRERIRQHWGLEGIVDVYPVSILQEGIFKIMQQDAGSLMMQQTFHLSPEIDIERFREIWREIVAQLDIFRTRIVYLPGSQKLFQVVTQDEIQWETADNLEDYSRTRLGAPLFGLGTRLYQFALIPDGAQGHHFVWMANHCIYDGWSNDRVLDILKPLYEGQSVDFGMPYKKFMYWAEDILHTDSSAVWEAQMTDYRGIDFPRLPYPKYPVISKILKVFQAPIPDLTGLNITVPTLLRAAWSFIIGQYTGIPDTAYGAVQNGRMGSLPGIVEMMAPVLAVIPVRAVWDDYVPVSSFLADVQQRVLDTTPYEQKGLPLRPPGMHSAGTPWEFQTALVIQPKTEDPTLIDGMRRVSLEHTERVQLSIWLELVVHAEHVEVRPIFDDGVLTEAQIDEIFAYYSHTLEQLCVNASGLMGDLDQLESWRTDVYKK